MSARTVPHYWKNVNHPIMFAALDIFVSLWHSNFGGGSEIRTHDTVSDMTVFPPEADQPLAGKIPKKSGGSEIRTHDTVSDMTVFKTVAFNHSAIPPLFCETRCCLPSALM